MQTVGLESINSSVLWICYGGGLYLIPQTRAGVSTSFNLRNILNVLEEDECQKSIRKLNKERS